jgi:putative peptidoglycan lipid II flippase
VLQFLVQLPLVLRLTHKLPLRPDTHSLHVREVLKNFLPVSVSRGVVQISAYADQSLASLVSRAAHNAAVAAMGNAQQIYMLPVSLFGMAVSAAELPAMSGTVGTDAEVGTVLRGRLNSGLRRIAFLIVPSAMAFFAFGDVITAALYQHGKFTHANSVYVWGIIAGSGIGLLASTLGRLYASTYYALRDTRTPLRFAVLRVALTVSLGYLCALPLPRWLGIGPQWGAAGLTASAGVAGWVEFTLLRRSLNRRIGVTGVPASLVARLWSAAALGAVAAWPVKLGMGAHHHPIVLSIPVLGIYGVVYFAATYAMQVPECAGMFQKVMRLRR